MIVLDASVTLELLLQTETGRPLAERLLAADEELCAPHLLDVEVAQVLRRYERGSAITPVRAAEALTDLADLPIERYGHESLLPRMWSLRQNLTAYDAAYLALAEALDATLLTCDSALARAPGHAAAVHFIPAGL